MILVAISEMQIFSFTGILVLYSVYLSITFENDVVPSLLVLFVTCFKLVAEFLIQCISSQFVLAQFSMCCRIQLFKAISQKFKLNTLTTEHFLKINKNLTKSKFANFLVYRSQRVNAMVRNIS